MYRIIFILVLVLSACTPSQGVLPTPGIQSIPQTIVYQNPTGLSLSQIGDRFDTAIMSRGKSIDFYSGYKSVGINNLYIYFMADYFSGVPNMFTLTQQSTFCTPTQRNYVPPATDNVTMDIGDFCKIHDAIVGHTCLTQYPDICPTESFFLHKFDGTRYVSADYYYNPNPSDLNWKKFFAYRSLRELQPTDSSHLPVMGVVGIFIDDLNASFSQLIARGGGRPPQEFATNELYDGAMVGFAHYIKQNIAPFKLIGNLNDFTSDWTPFINDLDGAISESWGTDWNTTINSTSLLATILDRAEAWANSGKTLYLITQGNSTGINNLFGLSLFEMIAQSGTEYRYLNSSSYATYLEVPEYYFQLGQPLGGRVKVNDNPLIYLRCFISGSVTVNLTAKTSSFGMPCGLPITPSVTNSPTFTFVPSITPTRTNTPTPTRTNTVTPPTVTRTNTPTSTPTLFSVIIVNGTPVQCSRPCDILIP